MKSYWVANIAAKDITEYLKEQNLKIQDENHDVWIVTPHRLVRDKNIRKLNKKLGLHKINK